MSALPLPYAERPKCSLCGKPAGPFGSCGFPDFCSCNQRHGSTFPTIVGGEPKVQGSSLTQAQEVPEAVPPHEPPSPPLTTADRESVQADLDQQRDLLARHANTEPLPGLLGEWSARYWMFVREIARLERILA